MQNNQHEPNKSINAEEYIKRHNLEPVLAEMLNTLVYEKVRNPEIFMIKYLTSLLTKEQRIKHGIHVPESSLPTSKKIVKYPAQLNNEVVKRHLTKKLWEEIKHKSTKFGATVNDILREGEGGITLTDSDCLNVFSELVTGVINSLHELSLPLRKIERTNEIPNKCIEYSWNNLQFYKFEYFRNLSNYPFPIKCNSSLLNEINEKIDATINSLDRTNPVFDFKQIKFSEKPFEFSDLLTNHRIFLWNSPSSNSTIYHNLNEDNLGDIKIFLVVNDNSHIRIVVNATKSKMFDAYERLSTIHKLLDEKFDFEFNSSYGFLNSNIRKLGNALSFYGEFVMDKLLENKPELFEEIRKTFDVSVLESNQLSQNADEQKIIKIYMTQNLKETENEFLENVFQRIHNLDYLNTNYNKDVRVENISSRINEEEEKTESSQEKKFFSAVCRSYNNCYVLHKFSHFHPNDITLNSIIEDILLNINNSEYFNLFPQFYTTYMMSYRSLYDDILQKKVYDHVNRNLQDFRESLINFNVFSFNVIRSFNFKIRRNIHGFNFSHYLSDAEKENLLKLLNERILETFGNDYFEFEISTNSYHLRDKQITIQLGKGDHLSFELNSKPRNSDLGKLIDNFFSIYQKLIANLELNKIKYLSSTNLGYFTNDLRHLGTGLTFSTEVDVKEQLDYVLPSNCFKEGFYLEKGNFDENDLNSLILGCNLNTNTGIYRIFKVLVDMFKSLKVPNYSTDIKQTIHVVNEELLQN